MADNEDENDLPLEELANLDLENVPLPEQNPVFQQEFQGNWDGVQPQPVFPPVDNQLIAAIGDWEDVQPQGLQQQDNQLLFDVLVAQLQQQDDLNEPHDFPPEANVDNQLLPALGGTMHAYCHRKLRRVEEVYDEQDITIRLIAYKEPLIDMLVEYPSWQDYSKTRERTPFKEEVKANKAVKRAMHDTRGRSEMVPDESLRVEIIKDQTSAEDVPVSVRQFFKLYVCNEFNPHPHSAHTMMDRRRPHVGYEDHKLEPGFQMWKVLAWMRMGSTSLEMIVVSSIDIIGDLTNWFPFFTDTVFPVLVAFFGDNNKEQLPHKNSCPLTDEAIESNLFNSEDGSFAYRSIVSLVWKFNDTSFAKTVEVGFDDKCVETLLFNAGLVSIRWEYYEGHGQIMIQWIIHRIIDYYDNDMDVVGLLSDERMTPPENRIQLSLDITREADIADHLEKNSPQHCSIQRFGIVVSKDGLLVVSETRYQRNFNSLLKECTYVLHDGRLCFMTNYSGQWALNSYHLPVPRLPFPYTPYIVIMAEGVNELDIVERFEGQQVHRFGALYRSDPQMSSELVIDWYGLVADFGIGLQLPVTFSRVVSTELIPDYVRWKYTPRFKNPQMKKYFFYLSLYRLSEVKWLDDNHKRLTDWINVWINGPNEKNTYVCSLRSEYTLQRTQNNQFLFVYHANDPRSAPFRLYMVCDSISLFGEHQKPLVSQMQYYFVENLPDDGMLHQNRSPNEEIRNMVMSAFAKSDKLNGCYYTRHREQLIEGHRLQFYI